MPRPRLTIPRLMFLVLACGLALAFVREVFAHWTSGEFLVLMAVVYFSIPILARLRPGTRIFWDWFEISGLLYLVISLGLWVNPPRPLPFPMYETLLGIAEYLHPNPIVDREGWGWPTALFDRSALVEYVGHFSFSLVFAAFGGWVAWRLSLRRVQTRAQERALSDKIIAEDECH